MPTPLSTKKKSPPRPSLSVFTVVAFLFISVTVSGLGYLGYLYRQSEGERQKYLSASETLSTQLETLRVQLQQSEQEIQALQSVDQKVRNDDLEKRLSEIQKVYADGVKQYQRVLVLQEDKADTGVIEKLLAKFFQHLSQDQLSDAQSVLAQLTDTVTDVEKKLATASAVAAPKVSVTSNAPPSSGYRRQAVTTDIGQFVVSLVAGDLASTKVIVDTASGSDCANDCPVLSLRDYVSRSGGYAGINGSYFCPASYPSCVGKTNSFDLLAMNKDKVYFNSANNVYSTNPAVIFSNGSVRFVSAASQWGRDTGVDGVLSNFPLLLQNGEVKFGGDGDPKKGSKGNRSFVANKGNMVYIGVVHSATVAEAARVLQTLGMENGMNLDSGGSTALWSGGYVVGPGRNIPNAIIFVRK